jgi:hypothetical protein
VSKYILQFEVQDLPHTTNSIGRKHWSVKAKEARKWREYVYCQAYNARPPQPLQKAKVTLIRRSSHSPDPDGLVSSFKHTIDGLVQAKVIANDKYDNIGMPDYRWEKAPPNQGSIKVIVEER